MSGDRQIFRGGRIFDGTRLHAGVALVIEDGRVAAILPEAEVGGGRAVDLAGDIISPGYVDLQVNGGDGVMLNDDPSVATLRRLADAHRQLGATTIFPTLITDTPQRSVAAIEAVAQAIAEGVPGIGGLHLEGPHISVARKGAHDAARIRSMGEGDLATLLRGAQALPALMVTLAPESVTRDQVRALSAAGVIVSLGHTDADFETCMAYQDAGAHCVTHLFNAMSQLGSRRPGLVGAALANPGLSAGLIADGFHVHPASMRFAIAAKAAPGGIFLVSDAMAPAGTELRSFSLGGRPVRRADGRLLLEDGTLAGADLDLTRAVDIMVHIVGVALETALKMATSLPARIGRQPGWVGNLVAGEPCSLIRLTRSGGTLSLADVMPSAAGPWRAAPPTTR